MEFSSKTTVLLLATSSLEEHSSDFSVINWPPRNPGLNSIDHLWDVLEQGVKDHHKAPTNLTELWTGLANIWQVIPMERFQKHVVVPSSGGRFQGQRPNSILCWYP
ncbi:transposable element Tcb2 transposase [Trichonephila clavipes]|nr:transposable element Tcb2 transposase [Trichonephila clavipes]